MRYKTGSLFTLALLFGGVLASPIFAQPVTDGEGDVVVGSSQVDPSAKFEIVSTTKGFLLPRMTEAERDAIVDPANSLMIFNTTTNEFDYYDGNTEDWETVITSANDDGFAWILEGNDLENADDPVLRDAWDGEEGAFLGTTSADNLVIATTEAQDIEFWTNNTERGVMTDEGRVGIGTMTPNNWVEVRADGIEGTTPGEIAGEQGQAFNVLATSTPDALRAIAVRGRMLDNGVSTEGTLIAPRRIMGVDGQATSAGGEFTVVNGGYFNSKLLTGATDGVLRATGAAADAEIEAGAGGFNPTQNLIGGRFGANATNGGPITATGVLAMADGNHTGANTGVLGWAANASPGVDVGVSGVANASQPQLGALLGTLTGIGDFSTGLLGHNENDGANEYALFTTDSKVRHGSLAGADSRLVVADPDGVLTAATDPVIAGGLTLNGDLDMNGNDIIDVGNLEFSQAGSQISNTAGPVDIQDDVTVTDVSMNDAVTITETEDGSGIYIDEINSGDGINIRERNIGNGLTIEENGVGNGLTIQANDAGLGIEVNGGAIDGNASGNELGDGTGGTQLTVVGDGANNTANGYELVVQGDMNVTGEFQSNGLMVTGDLDMDGNDIVDLGNLEFSQAGSQISNTGGDINIADNMIPTADNTYSLGSDALRWSDVFVNGGSVHIGDANGEGTDEMMLGYDGATTG